MDADSDSLSEDSLTEASVNIEKEKKADKRDTDGEEAKQKKNLQEGSVVGETKDSGLSDGGQVSQEQTPLPISLAMVGQVCTGRDLEEEEEETRLEDENQPAHRYRTSTPTLSLEQQQKESAALKPDESHIAMESELLIADSPITLDLSAQSSQVTTLSLEEGPKICRIISAPKEPVVSPPEQLEESDEEQFFSTGNDSLEVGGRAGEDVVKDEDTILEDAEKFGSDAGAEPPRSREIPDSGNDKNKKKNIKRQAKKKEAQRKEEEEGEKRSEEKREKQKEEKKKQEERDEHPRESKASVDIIQSAVTDQASLSDTISMSDTSELLHILPEGEGSVGPVGDVRPTPSSTVITTPTTTRILPPLDDDDDDDNDDDDDDDDFGYDNVGGKNKNLVDDIEDEGHQEDDVRVLDRQLHKTSDRPRWPRGLLSELKMATRQSRHQSLGTSLPSLSRYSRPSRHLTTRIDDQFLRRNPFSQTQPFLEALSKQPVGYYLDDEEDEPCASPYSRQHD